MFVTELLMHSNNFDTISDIISCHQCGRSDKRKINEKLIVYKRSAVAMDRYRRPPQSEQKIAKTTDTDGSSLMGQLSVMIHQIFCSSSLLNFQDQLSLICVICN